MLKTLMILPLVTLSFLFAIEESNIKSEMSSKIQEITTILQDKTVSRESKREQITPVLSPIFDYKIMSKISLGKKWKTLSDEEQSKFITAFEEKLKTSYFEKLELYTDEKVVVKALEKVKATRIKLYSDIVGLEETYEVIYKFYQVKNSTDWLIYDVEITGVSIIQTYRKQFAEFLKTKSFDELLASL